MTLIIIILITFCAGVFFGAWLTGSSKDKPLKTPMVEEFEVHWYKEENI